MQLDRLAGDVQKVGGEVERALAFAGERLNELGRQTSLCVQGVTRELERLASVQNSNRGAAVAAAAAPETPSLVPGSVGSWETIVALLLRNSAALEALQELFTIHLHPIVPLLLPPGWLQSEASSLEGLHLSTVLLRSYNGQFLGVKELKRGTSLMAKPATLRGRGLFKVYLLSGNKLALQSMADIPEKPFLTADNGQLLARATEIGDWEKFEAHFMEDGRVALYSCAQKLYVCCEDGGGTEKDVVCNRKEPAEWEMFRMVRVVCPASPE